MHGQFWLVLLALTCANGRAHAQESRSVPVRVTAVSSETVFLDQGRDAEIQIGDRVILYSRSHGILTATVRSVSRTSASCTLEAGALALDVGTRGEVLVPQRRDETAQPERPRQERPAAPEHPPWSAPPEEWNKDNPLLAPAFSRRPEERPTQFIGRTYVRGAYARDRYVNDSTFIFGRTGVDLTVINPVPWGGSFHVRSELLYKAARLQDADDTSETAPRLDRLSYAWGGLRGQSFRGQVGRFLHDEFPELGVIDGAECTPRLTDALRVGASAGAMPDVQRSLTLTDDFEAALFGRYTAGEKEEFALGLAYQKTWHEGDTDRDLLLAVAHYTPSPWFSARASAWIDYYTSSEVSKPSGFELTEAHMLATYRFDLDHGVGVFFTRIQRPELLRDELAPEVAELLQQNKSIYYGAYSWHHLSPYVLVDTRVSPWIDQDGEHGMSGEARLALQNLLFEKGEVSLTAYYTDGAYNSGPGARLSVSRLFAPVYATAWYDIARYEYAATGKESLQHWLHLSLDATLSPTWSTSLSGDTRFGDDQDSHSFTLSIEKRI